MLRPLFLVFKFFFRFLLLLIVARVLLYFSFSDLVAASEDRLNMSANLFDDWFVQGVIYDAFMASYIAKGALFLSFVFTILPFRIIEKVFKLYAVVTALFVAVIIALATRGASFIGHPLTYNNFSDYIDLFTASDSVTTGMDKFMVIVVLSLFFVLGYRAVARRIGLMYEFYAVRSISERIISAVVLFFVSIVFLNPTGSGLRGMAGTNEFVGNKVPSAMEQLLIQGPIYTVVDGAIGYTLEELEKYSVPIESVEATDVDVMEMHVAGDEVQESEGVVLISMDDYEE